MTYNLKRFISAQLRDYKQAYKEIKNGKKLTHWMWYIFPQLKGLGSSEYAEYYGIESIEEAKAYWDNDYLRHNLTNICLCLLSQKHKTAEEIFGHVDSLKLKSCVTLFLEATREPIFQNVLGEFFCLKPDQRTIDLIGEKSTSLIVMGKKTFLDFCDKYLPFLEEYHNNEEIRQWCLFYNGYDYNGDHQEWHDKIYKDFLINAYNIGLVFADAIKIYCFGLREAWEKKEEGLKESLTFKQILAIIDLEIRSDYTCDNLTEKIGDGTLLELLKLAKTRF